MTLFASEKTTVDTEKKSTNRTPQALSNSNTHIVGLISQLLHTHQSMSTCWERMSHRHLVGNRHLVIIT